MGRSSPQPCCNAARLSTVEAEIIQASQGDLQAQQRILDYFTEQYNKGLFLTLHRESRILKALELKNWEQYLCHYTPIFTTLCASKAIREPQWVLPHSVYEQIKTYAEQNELLAQTNLGYLYKYGLQVTKDDTQASSYWQLAAEQGLPHAQCSLAIWLLDNCKTPEGKKQALMWAKEAAEKGSLEGQWLVGMFYRQKGKLEKAFYHWKQAARQGSIKALTELGIMYQDGLYVKQDDKIAYKFYELAAEQEDLPGLYHLAILLVSSNEIEKDEARAFNLCLLSTQQKFSPAYLVIARMYESGIGTPINQELALHYYKLAAKDGQVPAQEKLANIYLGEMAHAINFDKLVKWTIKGSQRGSLSLQRLFKELIQKTDNSDTQEEASFKGVKNFSKILKNIYGNHLLEGEINNSTSNANSLFKERGLASPALYTHYKQVIRLEEKILHLLPYFTFPGFLVNGWTMSKAFFFNTLKGKAMYFDEYKLGEACYLALGKENVSHSREIIRFLKGEDRESKEGINSLKTLQAVFQQSINLLEQELRINQQEGIASNEEAQLHELIEGQERHLRSMEATINLIFSLEKLVHEGASHRNFIFKEAYPFLKEPN